MPLTFAGYVVRAALLLVFVGGVYVLTRRHRRGRGGGSGRAGEVVPTELRTGRGGLRALGPWGERLFRPADSTPAPASRLAAELGLPSSPTLLDMRRALRNKSWDSGEVRWYND